MAAGRGPPDRSCRIGRGPASANLAQIKSLEAATEAASAPTDPENIAGPGSATRRLAGRVFIRRGGVWTDASHRDTVKVAVVTSFSDAYFSLVRALPELTACLRIGDEVLIAGRRVGIRIGPSGVRVWAAGQLEQLVRDFRGT